MVEKIPSVLLQDWQSQPLEWKIERSKLRIKQFYERLNGQVYVAFSGGKDSTVLLHLVRSLYPNVTAVFVDTGLEFPEIKEFVKTIDNVITLRPKMGFREVLEKYGYPVISKEVSMAISRYRETKNPGIKNFRLTGNHPDGRTGLTMGVIPKKYQYLINAPFKISDTCCDIMKKRPMNHYEKTTRTHPFIGIMASDSRRRRQEFLANGCNTFNEKHISGKPLGFWLEEDVWNYIRKYNIPYSKIYDMGERRTGCMFCMFGLGYDGCPNRFQRMKNTHPQLWDYCMDKLGLQRVLDYMGEESGRDKYLEQQTLV